MFLLLRSCGCLDFPGADLYSDSKSKSADRSVRPTRSLAFNSGKQVSLLRDWPAFHCSHQVEDLSTASLPRKLLKLRPQGLLAHMRAERRHFRFHILPDLDGCTDGCESDGLSSRKSEVSGAVIELLRPVSIDGVIDLVGKPVTAPRPMEGKSREDRCHGVVGMASDTTG